MTIASEIAAIQDEGKAVRMVTDQRQYFFLTNEDGSLAEPLTSGRRVKRYFSYDRALERARRIVKGGRT